MGQNLWLVVLDRPATFTITIILSGIWFLLNKHGLGYTEAGMSYERAVEERQAWRIITSQVSHISLVHLGFNLSALWVVSSVENSPGTGTEYYVRVTCWLIVLTGLIELLIQHIAVVCLQRTPNRLVLTVGYSGVLFGWMTILAAEPGSYIDVLGATLPGLLAPFASLVLTTFLVPHTSFIGHVSGILAGFLLASGADDFLGNYVTAGLISIVLTYLAFCVWTGRMRTTWTKTPVIVDLENHSGSSMQIVMDTWARRS